MIGSSSLVTALVILSIINTACKVDPDYIPVFKLLFMADIGESIIGKRRKGIYTGVNSFFKT